MSESAEDSLVPVLPITAGNCKLVLKDEFGIENFAADLEELQNSNDDGAVDVNNAQINIENSSDVIIGSVTKFVGPVNIYQNVSLPEGHTIRENGQNSVQFANEAKIIKQASETNNTTSAKSFNFKYLSRKVSTILIIICLLLSISFVLTITLLNKFPGKDSDINFSDTPLVTEIDDPIYDRNLSNHALVYRNEWHGRNPTNTRQLTHPCALVIISHTATGPCHTKKDCKIKVQLFQDYHVGLGNSDIGYNFVIGGDANIYVGRGWDFTSFHSKNSVGISFVGNFVYEELTPQMIEATQLLLEQGVRLKKISKDYMVVSHNQTFNTASPGANVYKVIKMWSHFNATYVKV